MGSHFVAFHKVIVIFRFFFFRRFSPIQNTTRKNQPENVSFILCRLLPPRFADSLSALREKLGRETARTRQSIARQRRLARSASGQNETEQENATRECTRHELYVDFRDIGLSSSIIAPAGYSAYQCKGVCEPPLSQDQRPTNHATIQATVHKMGLVKGVERPCCVPTKLLSTSILFYDDNGNVVLKMYEDMIADRCGCR